MSDGIEIYAMDGEDISIDVIAGTPDEAQHVKCYVFAQETSSFRLDRDAAFSLYRLLHGLFHGAPDADALCASALPTYEGAVEHCEQRGWWNHQPKPWGQCLVFAAIDEHGYENLTPDDLIAIAVVMRGT